jgi:VacB/RNase II family 3'-5' exoribonuclease
MPNDAASHLDLQAIAREAMIEHGFEPDFPPQVQSQLIQLKNRAQEIRGSDSVRDLRNLLWSSIDNDTSRDLDQIEFVEQFSGDHLKIMVGIADVDSFVPKGSPIDLHAARETTTVYAGIRNFPMLPEELSTGETSLLENEDRLSVVIEFTVDGTGAVIASEIYQALVRNKAQLQYNSVGDWLEGRGSAPAKVAASTDLQAQVKLQDEVAQRMRDRRYQNGALNIQTDEVRPLILNEQVIDVVKQQKNRATELIEDFMVASNGVVARYLEKVSSLRRIVKTPERWDRIVQLAEKKGEKLPPNPDSKTLNDFLIKQKVSDPDHFADLSLAVIKLIGPGQYVLERAGEVAPGHFGLAVQDYTHSTAPNRRFADVVTQRLIKATLGGQSNPYSDEELTSIAANCTQKEDAARKVEREVGKRLAAVAMQHRIGETFDAIVTGVTPHGTFVRVLQPRIDGLLAQGAQGVDVGDKIQAKLVRTDVQKGYIDFARA